MMRPWRRRRQALVCRDAVALMTAYLDAELAVVDRERLEAHLAGCVHCAEYLAQLRITVAALGRVHVEVDIDQLPEDAVAELADLYRRWRSG